MSELAQKTASEHAAPVPEIDAKLKKLEFNLLILTALILVVFLLCRPG
jgi:hypothetical protein